MDRALGALAGETITEGGSVALVAVGGYGRGELSPHSDIDVLVLCRLGPEGIEAERLRAFLYPLWDSGWPLGHALRTPAEAVDFARRDLHAAAALLSARPLAGDVELFEELIVRRARWLHAKRRALLRRIADESIRRRRAAERAGWALAPDLKDDSGGLRDVHLLEWLQVIGGEVDLGEEVASASGVLLAGREALHSLVTRKSDRLRMDLQPLVAARCGYDGDGSAAADALMAEIHSAARVIEYATTIALEETAERVLAGPRRSGSSARLTGVQVSDGRLRLDHKAPAVTDVINLLAAHSHSGKRIARSSLALAAGSFDRPRHVDWDERLRDAFLRLLRGRHAPAALELIELLGGWPVLLPEWGSVRGRPQHDPYHRYTVDGHCFAAVGELSRVVEEQPAAQNHAAVIGNLDTLYLATLLHDVGKGSEGDHSIAGAAIAERIARRLGFADDYAREVEALVRHHLLLPFTATRRDLEDPGVVAMVADAAGSGRRLRQLALLTIADGRATSAHAWTEWKASLVNELIGRCLVALEGGEPPGRPDVAEAARALEAREPLLAGRAEDLLATLPPSYSSSTPVDHMAQEMKLLLRRPRPGEILSRLDGVPGADTSVLTVCCIDRPGTLARIAGTLALNRISVVTARAYVTNQGVALTRVVTSTPPSTLQSKLRADLDAVFAGRVALDSRMLAKVRDYHPQSSIPLDISVLDDASETSTVVEVRGPDVLGLLYATSAGIADLDLDIHVAKVDTLGSRVVDVFYVRTSWGSKLTAEQAAELPRAIEHRIRGLFGLG